MNRFFIYKGYEPPYYPLVEDEPLFLIKGNLKGHTQTFPKKIELQCRFEKSPPLDLRFYRAQFQINEDILSSVSFDEGLSKPSKDYKTDCFVPFVDLIYEGIGCAHFEFYKEEIVGNEFGAFSLELDEDKLLYRHHFTVLGEKFLFQRKQFLANSTSYILFPQGLLDGRHPYAFCGYVDLKEPAHKIEQVYVEVGWKSSTIVHFTRETEWKKTHKPTLKSSLEDGSVSILLQSGEIKTYVCKNTTQDKELKDKITLHFYLKDSQ